MTIDGKPKAIRYNGKDIIHLTISSLHVRTTAANLNLPKFPPKQAKVLEKYKGTSIMKLLAGDRVMCCKVVDDRPYLAIN